MRRMNYVITAVALAGIVVAGIYFLRKRNGNYLPIARKTMDKLSLFDVKEFFQQNTRPLAEGCKAVVLKMGREQAQQMQIDLSENTGVSYYILAYYDEKQHKVLDGYTLVETKAIDSHLAEAFGSKDMLIVE